jgi:hypothetical protein
VCRDAPVGHVKDKKLNKEGRSTVEKEGAYGGYVRTDQMESDPRVVRMTGL